MLWGCMLWDGPGYACRIDGRMDGDLFIQILRLVLLFQPSKGNKVDCMMGIGWEESDRITTRGLGEVREMLRINF